MNPYTALLKFKNRLSDTTGAITQEYALVSVISLFVITMLGKLIQSPFFEKVLEALVGYMIDMIPTMFAQLG